MLKCFVETLEVMSCWRDPQLQLSKNYTDLTQLRNGGQRFWHFANWCHLLYTTCSKARIQSGPAVKWFRNGLQFPKHHFTSLRTHLIFLQPRVLERKFPWNWLNKTWQFPLILNYIESSSSTTSRELWMKMAMVNSGLKGLTCLEEHSFTLVCDQVLL